MLFPLFPSILLQSGCLTKALELAFEVRDFETLEQVSEGLNEQTDLQVLLRCAKFFLENLHFDRAVNLFAAAKHVSSLQT